MVQHHRQLVQVERSHVEQVPHNFVLLEAGSAYLVEPNGLHGML